jgi:hypothetical protein
MSPPEIVLGSMIAGVCGWQLAATLLVDVEYFDGLETMLNARYLLGDAPRYSPARWPFMTLLALPAEALRGPLGLHPLDVRIDHAMSGALHVLYAAGVAALLRRCCGGGWAVVAAWAAAIPTYVFFSYAPFLSNDLAPGVALLWMILLADRHLSAPSTRGIVLLVALGAASALVKPIYGLFWLSLLIAIAGAPGPAGGLRLRRFGQLSAAAVASAAIYWLVCAALLPAEDLGVPRWLSPYAQIRDLASGAGTVETPAWVYLRNLPGYGYAAVVLLVPALAMAARTAGTARTACIAWLVCAAAVQLHPQREVRYLAFLAPTTALLIVAPLRVLLTSHRLVVAATIAGIVLPWLPFVTYSPLDAARQIARPFYRESDLRSLLEPLGFGAERRRPLAVLSHGLSFTPDGGSSPLAGDRYHRIHHFGRALMPLLGYREGEVLFGEPRSLGELMRAGFQGFVLRSSAGGLANPVSWQGGPPPGRRELRQWIGYTAQLELRPQPDGGHATPSGDVVHMRDAAHGDRALAVLRDETGALRRLRGAWLELPDAAGAQRRFPLESIEGIGLAAPQLSRWPADARTQALRLGGVLVQREHSYTR